MKSLILVRHAAAGSASDGSDIRRPLSPEGRKQAGRISEKLAERNVNPDRIIASPADRAFDTARALAAAFQADETLIRTDERIYDASAAGDLLDVVRDLDDGLSAVLLVGHQPVIGELTALLCPEYSGTFPKAGAACIGMDIASWREAGFGAGKLLWFEAP
jgi:phosphohistidine phosphatase